MVRKSVFSNKNTIFSDNQNLDHYFPQIIFHVLSLSNYDYGFAINIVNHKYDSLKYDPKVNTLVFDHELL